MVESHSLKSSLKVAGACCAAGAGVGAALGASLGLFAPSYYRSLFEGGFDPPFQPVAVGFGLGLSQGALAGVVLAGVLLLRPRQHATPAPYRATWPLWVAIALLSLHAVSREIPGVWGPSRPNVAWREGKLALWNFGPHDMVATHIVAGYALATLPRPLFLQSHWNEETVDVAALDWRDSHGEKTAAPAPGERIEAVVVETLRPMR